MERLDKVLAGTGRWSRREVKDLVRQGRVRIDGMTARTAEEKLDPDAAAISVDGQPVETERFTYVTNGIDHRRWLAQINPRLHGLVCEALGGDGYLTKPEELIRLKDLAEAYNQAIWFASTFPLKDGPFLCALPQEPNDLLVRALGTAGDASAYREGNGQVHVHGVEAHAPGSVKAPRRKGARSQAAKDKEDLRRTF